MRFRFFNQLIDFPDDAVALRDRILTESLLGTQGRPIAYFVDYIQQGGGRNHPLLGNLMNLADEIDARRDIGSGLNLVSHFIRRQFTDQPELAGMRVN